MVDEIINEFYDKDHHYGYDYVYTIDYAPKNDKEFRLHNHDDSYEIFLFISGDANFHIEGNIYQSHPHNIYIARPFELHHNVFLSTDKYERIIINLKLDFFDTNNCKELESIFINRELGTQCQIPGKIVDREMYHLIMKMNQYLKEGAYDISKYVLFEFLYLLNHIDEPLTVPTIQDERIKNILIYINEHLSESLSLDQLSQKLFINKYYLCRIFKAFTGYTINQYINTKRLLLAHELAQKGQSLLEASVNAGFNNYSHFYKMHKKKFGTSPKITLLLL
ncbi:MAG: helix-turn-helix transcriptional regulator [Clostridiales bacterium]|nr:helix-turn-helix transcriptional regulator [Clostridiales bacterium]